MLLGRPPAHLRISSSKTPQCHTTWHKLMQRRDNFCNTHCFFLFDCNYLCCVTWTVLTEACKTKAGSFCFTHHDCWVHSLVLQLVSQLLFDFRGNMGRVLSPRTEASAHRQAVNAHCNYGTPVCLLGAGG